jgi:hypothetical protein
VANELKPPKDPTDPKEALQAVKRYSLVISEAWFNREFEQRLMADPKAAFREMGIEISPNIEVRAVPAGHFNGFAIPRRDEQGALTDETEGLADFDDVVHGNVPGGVVYFSLPGKPEDAVGDESISAETCFAAPKNCCIWPFCSYGRC